MYWLSNYIKSDQMWSHNWHSMKTFWRFWKVVLMFNKINPWLKIIWWWHSDKCLETESNRHQKFVFHEFFKESIPEEHFYTISYFIKAKTAALLLVIFHHFQQSVAPIFIGQSFEVNWVILGHIGTVWLYQQ